MFQPTGESSAIIPILAFLLVASFGRLAIRLNADLVGLILQASIGGVATDFIVIHLSGWMFQFSVSCKEVGFMIYKLKSFSCKQFAIHFFLWGNGGPDWRSDHAIWCTEREAEWTLVGAKHKKSYADDVRSTSCCSTFSILAKAPTSFQMHSLPGQSLSELLFSAICHP